MKRVVVAVCLLVAAVTAGVALNVTLCRACDELGAEMAAVQALAEQGDAQGAAARFEEAYRTWEKRSLLFHGLVDHGLMTEAEISLGEARHAAQTGDLETLADEADDCVQTFYHIKVSSEPTAGNIF